MGFAKTLGRNLSKRCFQYAVRSTYPMFEKPKKNYGYDYDIKPKNLNTHPLLVIKMELVIAGKVKLFFRIKNMLLIELKVKWFG